MGMRAGWLARDELNRIYLNRVQRPLTGAVSPASRAGLYRTGSHGVHIGRGRRTGSLKHQRSNPGEPSCGTAVIRRPRDAKSNRTLLTARDEGCPLVAVRARVCSCHRRPVRLFPVKPPFKGAQHPAHGTARCRHVMPRQHRTHGVLVFGAQACRDPKEPQLAQTSLNLEKRGDVRDIAIFGVVHFVLLSAAVFVKASNLVRHLVEFVYQAAHGLIGHDNPFRSRGMVAGRGCD
jgi:hypothetical protein